MKNPEETVPGLKEPIETLKEQSMFTKKPMKENIEQPAPEKVQPPKPKEDK